MRTMTSLDAQNQFGVMIDASQREPVIITRRGRPVSVLLSFQDFNEMPFPVAKALSDLHPLKGKDAAKAARKLLASFSSRAKADGLTEAKVMKIVHENRA